MALLSNLSSNLSHALHHVGPYPKNHDYLWSNLICLDLFNWGRFWICKRLLLFFCIDVSIWQTASCPLLCDKLDILKLRPWGALWIFFRRCCVYTMIFLREDDANAKKQQNFNACWYQLWQIVAFSPCNINANLTKTWNILFYQPLGISLVASHQVMNSVFSPFKLIVGCKQKETKHSF